MPLLYCGLRRFDISRAEEFGPPGVANVCNQYVDELGS